MENTGLGSSCPRFNSTNVEDQGQAMLDIGMMPWRGVSCLTSSPCSYPPSPHSSSPSLPPTKLLTRATPPSSNHGLCTGWSLPAAFSLNRGYTSSYTGSPSTPGSACSFSSTSSPHKPKAHASSTKPASTPSCAPMNSPSTTS
ncbi:hypothetical protein V495_04286 [Pseudogymnoascus sp. VKM F-4514 (FW-929)]|nr:hypothetical protein V495_04286 [Pseudogymnoascus sp. VKM F-4514 (FW-929)]